ncbi:MAG: YIP1 family protein [Blastocatellia bacterium]
MTPEQQTLYPTQPVAAAAPQNFFSRLIGVFFSPGETFRDIGRAPTWLAPTLALILITGAMSYLTIQRIGYENIIRKQFQSLIDKGMVPQDRAEEMIEQKLKDQSGGVVMSAVQGAAFFVVALLIVAGLLKLISALMGADNTFKQVFSVTAWSFFVVGLVTSFASTIVLYLKPVEEIDMFNVIGSNLGAVLKMVMGDDALPKYVYGLLGYVDLFYIWRIALLSIGLAAVTAKLKTGTAAWWIGGLFFFFALLGALASTFFG